MVGNDVECHLCETKDGKVVCTQSDTINRIYSLNRTTDKRIDEFQDDMHERDDKLRDAFNEVNNNVNLLRQELDDRKYINNLNEKEKEILRNRVNEVGSKSEEVDEDIKDCVKDLDKRLVRVETNLPNILKCLDDLASDNKKLLYLIATFFILFILKTFVGGI